MLNKKERAGIQNNIKFYRNEIGLSQKELAEKSQISERHIIDLEKGVQDPKISTVHKLSNALGVAVEELFPRKHSTK